MTTLAAFLLARIAEDEAAARAVPPLDYNVDMGGNRQEERWVFDRTLPSSADGMGNWSKHRHSPTTAEHFERHDPARVLAECDAKRRIVEEIEQADGLDLNPPAELAYAALRVPKLLALPYADHPDYQEAWKP